MRLGVLDIGSNSAQCQIVEIFPGAPPLPMHALKQPVLLGRAMSHDGTLSEEGIERAAVATERVLHDAYVFGVDQLYAFVTAAIRDAPNRDIVLDRIEERAGLRPQFLSGQDEARLTYVAVHNWYGWRAGRILVLDIGGGSMEIALGRDSEPEFVMSLPLGAGRLSRRFFSGDPPRPAQIRRLRRHVRSTLREASDRLLWEGAPRLAVGSSKTFKQLARLCGAPPQRDGPFVRRELTRRHVQRSIDHLAGMPEKQRALLRGISSARSDQIIAGAVVAAEAMKSLHLTHIEISPWALREGVILQHLSTALEPSAALPLEPMKIASATARASVTRLRQHGGDSMKPVS